MMTKTQMLVRLPLELKMRLKDRAAGNRRTTTAELIHILERVMSAEPKLAPDV
jgi:plasmid stability protein